MYLDWENKKGRERPLKDNFLKMFDYCTNYGKALFAKNLLVGWRLSTESEKVTFKSEESFANFQWLSRCSINEDQICTKPWSAVWHP